MGIPDALHAFACKGVGLLELKDDSDIEAIGDGVGGSRWDVH